MSASIILKGNLRMARIQNNIGLLLAKVIAVTARIEARSLSGTPAFMHRKRGSLFSVPLLL